MGINWVGADSLASNCSSHVYMSINWTAIEFIPINFLQLQVKIE